MAMRSATRCSASVACCALQVVESRIYVETATQARRRTSDYRDMVDEVEAGDLLLHHFSLGSRASRQRTRCPAG
jgi:hypothetical protein